MTDFCVRMAAYDNNRRYMDSLISSGAFDGFPQTRLAALFELAASPVSGAAKSGR